MRLRLVTGTIGTTWAIAASEQGSVPVNQAFEGTVRRRQKLWWLATINQLGAIASAIWLLWVVFEASGFWHMLLGALFLGFFLWPGPALLFAVAASVLCFRYSVVDIWLPLLSYCSAGAAFLFDWRVVRKLDLEQDADSGIIDDKIVDWQKFNTARWSEQLAGIVDELGIHSPEIDIRVYPGNTIDHTAEPLFTARPDECKVTLSRLLDEFGGGSFSVIVFVKGQIRRRFTLLVNV